MFVDNAVDQRIVILVNVYNVCTMIECSHPHCLHLPYCTWRLNRRKWAVHGQSKTVYNMFVPGGHNLQKTCSYNQGKLLLQSPRLHPFSWWDYSIAMSGCWGTPNHDELNSKNPITALASKSQGFFAIPVSEDLAASLIFFVYLEYLELFLEGGSLARKYPKRSREQLGVPAGTKWG